MDYKKEYAKLQKEFEQYKKESIKWSIEDFIEYGKKMEIKVSKKEAQEMVEQMISDHDAEHGINWYCVEYWVQSLQDDRSRNKNTKT